MSGQFNLVSIVQGRCGGWPGQPRFNDTTKLYFVAPFIVDYGPPAGIVTYNITDAIPLPSNPTNAPVYVTLLDPRHNGQPQIFAELTSTKFLSGQFVQVGILMPGADVVNWTNPTFGASGTGHSPGLVPDPGSSSGTTHFLREDATWAVPAGGGGGFVAQSQITLSASDIIALSSGGHKELVPGVANNVLVPSSFTFQYVPGSTPFSSGGSPILWILYTGALSEFFTSTLPNGAPGTNVAFLGMTAFGGGVGDGTPPGQPNSLALNGTVPIVQIAQGIFVNNLTSTVKGSGLSIAMVSSDSLSGGNGSLIVTLNYYTIPVS